MSAEENHKAIEARAGKELRAITQDVIPSLLTSRMSKARKFIRLRVLADKAMEMVAPNTPCKKGCSYCCHIAVPISESEAQAIAEYTGRSVAKVVRPTIMEDREGTQKHLNLNTERFYKKPCTLLGVEGECTVYPVRPIPCRTFNVVEDSSERCDMFSGQIPVAIYMMPGFDTAAVAIFLDEVMADIREFFPPDF